MEKKIGKEKMLSLTTHPNHVILHNFVSDNKKYHGVLWYAIKCKKTLPFVTNVCMEVRENKLSPFILSIRIT